MTNLGTRLWTSKIIPDATALRHSDSWTPGQIEDTGIPFENLYLA
jgi:hypothetical protein